MGIQVDGGQLAPVEGKAASTTTGAGRTWIGIRAIRRWLVLLAFWSWRSVAVVVCGSLRSAASHVREAPRQRRGKPVPLVWASHIALGLLIAGTTSLLVLQSRATRLAEADRELRGLALILADQAERSFEAVDLIQTTFLEMVRADGIQTPEGFRQRMSGLAVNKELDDHGRALPQLDVMGLWTLTATSSTFPIIGRRPPSTSPTGPTSRHLRQIPHLTTFVSDPVREPRSPYHGCCRRPPGLES